MNAFIISQAVREFTGDEGYIFDPEGFVTDEHGGNRESIRRMLKPGAVDRANSCENHFYDCGHKQERRDWSSCSKLTFRKMLHEIYHAPTPGAFEANRRKLIDWTDKKTENQGHIKSWFNKFWFKRRMHVFRAFKTAHTPNTNMAEAGHLRNATRGAKNKSLATVTKEHIVECALLKSKLEMHESGTYKGGHCPTQRQKHTATFRRQRDRAAQFEKELEPGYINPRLYSTLSFVDPSLSHRAPKRTGISTSDDIGALSASTSSENESTLAEGRKTAKASFRKRKGRSKVFQDKVLEAFPIESGYVTEGSEATNLPLDDEVEFRGELWNGQGLGSTDETVIENPNLESASAGTASIGEKREHKLTKKGKSYKLARDVRERKRLKRETQAQIANIQTLMGLNRNLEKVSQECIKLNERFKLFGDLHEEIQDLLSGEEQAQDHQVYINLHEEIVPFREVVQKWMTNAEQQLRDGERERNSTKSSLKSKNSKASRASTTSSRTRALETKAKEVELRTRIVLLDQVETAKREAE